MQGPAVRKVFPILAVVVLLSCLCEAGIEVAALRGGVRVAATKAPLRFRSNGTFKIVQIADLHFGENEDGPWGPVQDSNSTEAVTKVLKAEDPDLVVFSGDQVTGNNIGSNATVYWQQVIEIAAKMGYPFASIFGNHDDLASGAHGTRRDLMAMDMSYPLSYSQMGPENLHGISNYVLELLPPPGTPEDEAPETIVYFLDSGGGQEQPGYVFDDQVEWYRNTSTALETKYKTVVPAISFVHIPLTQYDGIYDGRTCVGMDENGGVTPFDKDLGLFAAFKERNDVKAVFVGHDHGNDWCCPYKGIELCFGRHSGYGGYGDWDRGARVVMLSKQDRTEPLSLKTWVRMEDGSSIHDTSIQMQ